jgi:hypothetical protein
VALRATLLRRNAKVAQAFFEQVALLAGMAGTIRALPAVQPAVSRRADGRFGQQQALFEVQRTGDGAVIESPVVML